jgi:hypothetical protein
MRAPVEKQNGESPQNQLVHETGLSLAWRLSLYSWEPYGIQGTVKLATASPPL